jgi:hypothetical protein
MRNFFLEKFLIMNFREVVQPGRISALRREGRTRFESCPPDKKICSAHAELFFREVFNNEFSGGSSAR